MTYIILLICSNLNLAAGIDARLIPDYSQAGSNRSIVYPNKIHFTSDLNISSGNSSDCSAVVNNFIDTVQTPAMLVFEPGTYLFSSPLSLKSDIIISGYNSDLTKLHFDFSGEAKTCINISGKAKSQFVGLKSVPKQNTNIIITESDIDAKQYDMIEIRQENGKWDKSPADWAKNSVGQFMAVEMCNLDSIETIEKIYFSYDLNLNPELRVIDPIENVVIQYLGIERLDEPETGAGYNINISKGYNCIVRGIESDKSVGSHVMISGSKNCEVRDSYIHHAFTFDGSGTRGYGVTLNDHCSDCKIENNIFRHLRHAMVAKHGANGNVIAFNYAFETKRSEPISDFAGDIQLHGHYPYANLIESNIVNNIWIDDYWGPSGPRNVFFRNRVKLYGFFCTSPTTDSLLVLANETTGNGLAHGLYNVQGNNHIEIYNNIRGKTDKTDDSFEPLPASLIYAGAPKFWNITDPFPSIGYPIPPLENTIPSKFRYDNSERKTVGEFVPTSIEELQQTSETENITNLLKNNPRAKINVYNYRGELLFGGLSEDLDLDNIKSSILLIRYQNKLYKLLK